MRRQPLFFHRDGRPFTYGSMTDLSEEWMVEYAEEYEKDRGVCRTFLPNGNEVSTVFLVNNNAIGDRPPEIFETIIFGGDQDNWMWRYHNEVAATIGHSAAVVLARQDNGSTTPTE